LLDEEKKNIIRMVQRHLHIVESKMRVGEGQIIRQERLFFSLIVKNSCLNLKVQGQFLFIIILRLRR